MYVDDIIITENDLEERTKLKQELMEEFAVKNLGPIKYFLGIKVAHSSKGIIFSHQKYTLDLLTETSFTNCQPAKTPIEVKYGLKWIENELEANIGSYQRLVGKLINLLHTCLDIAYVINCLGNSCTILEYPTNKLLVEYLDT